MKIEPLHPDLTPWRGESNGIPGIFHPLVYSIFHADFQNAQINAAYLYKKERARTALKTEDYQTYVWLHERPYRLQAFSDIHNQLDHPTYWRLLGQIYTDSENIWQNKKLWKRLLEAKRPDSHHFMDDSEQEAFTLLPDTLTLYRGFHKGRNAIGWSYTLTESKALWFASRLSKDTSRALVKRITVTKQEALALKTCRDEDEIVLRKPR